MNKSVSAANYARLLFVVGVGLVSVFYHGQRQRRLRQRLDDQYQQAGFDLSILDRTV